jgi:hypothetical protein
MNMIQLKYVPREVSPRSESLIREQTQLGVTITTIYGRETKESSHYHEIK